MTSLCLVCLRKIEDLYMNLVFEPFCEGLSLLQIFNSVSILQIEEKNTIYKKICQDCTHVIISFHNLIKNYKERKSYRGSDPSKREEVFFLDEQDYDNYVECETESCRESEECLNEEINNHDKNVTEWITKEKHNQDPPEMLPELKVETKPRVFDEFGNEEIISRKYTCDECGDSFLFKVGFSSHMAQKHSMYIENHHYEQYSTEITVKIPPASADINFIRKQVPKKNIKLEENTSRCQICKETLSTVDELKEHYNTHKTHVCEHCGAAFIKHSYLRDHLLVHTSIKRYTCDICGKKFKYRNGLAVHKNIHINFRGFMCDTCGQGFNAKSTLKTHMKLKHSDERNWPCPECDLTFKVKSWLDKHYSRKHTLNRTKDFVCNLCGIAYLNKTTLTRHITEKHTGTPVRHYCTVCEKSYSMKTKLNLHMQKKHNIILNNSSSQLII